MVGASEMRNHNLATITARAPQRFKFLRQSGGEALRGCFYTKNGSKCLDSDPTAFVKRSN